MGQFVNRYNLVTVYHHTKLLIMAPNAADKCPVINNAGEKCPVMNPSGFSSSIQSHGPRDIYTLEALSHFNREKIPERAVHAKGTGAYGEFEVRRPSFIFVMGIFTNTI